MSVAYTYRDIGAVDLERPRAAMFSNDAEGWGLDWGEKVVPMRRAAV